MTYLTMRTPVVRNIIKEADETTEQNNNVSAEQKETGNPQLDNAMKALADIRAKKASTQAEYSRKLAAYAEDEKRAIELIRTLGGIPESQAIRFSSMLFESVPNGRRAELFSAIKIAQENVAKDLSKTMDDTAIKTFTKNLCKYINQNEAEWRNDNINHWEEGEDGTSLSEVFTNMYRNSAAKPLETDIKKLVPELGKVLSQSTFFLWLFKNNENA